MSGTAPPLHRTLLRAVGIAVGTAVALSTAGCADRFDDGLDAWRAGRFEQALQAFTEVEQAAGDDAGPATILDRALAALAAHDLRVAELSADKLAVRGGVELRPLRDFLLGNASFARCQMAEAEAGLADPDPTALDRAIRHVTDALGFWIAAAEARGDWPAARRNAERAARKLAELEKRRAEARNDPRREGQPDARPDARPDDGTQPQQVEQRPDAQTDRAEVTVEALLERLAQREREKLDERRARRAARSADVEADW
ncbi:MAG: hypothetical protein IPM29_09265 [Planctomycetes bacterium]|nr:hypothetical protein [Planctomycetota bacterium]